MTEARKRKFNTWGGKLKEAGEGGWSQAWIDREYERLRVEV